MTVEGGSLLLPMRQIRRNCAEYLEQVATQKATTGHSSRAGRQVHSYIFLSCTAGGGIVLLKKCAWDSLTEFEALFPWLLIL